MCVCVCVCVSVCVCVCLCANIVLVVYDMPSGRTEIPTTERLSSPATTFPSSVTTTSTTVATASLPLSNPAALSSAFVTSVSTTQTTVSLGSSITRPVVDVSLVRTEATATARLRTSAAASLASARPDATTTLALSDNVCGKCGTVKRNGRVSCCAPGGAWFLKCGDPGDSNFDHTWREGIQACRGKFSTP